MTVNFEFVNKLRDVLVAEQVGKKAALGYFDFEFTLYGCAYYAAQDDRIYYKISSRELDIYQYVEQAPLQGIFPSNVENITLKCHVPLGEKETIEKRLKYKLANELKVKYPMDFLRHLHDIAQKAQNNSAAPILWAITDEIDGYFAEHQLKEFESLLQYTYSCLKLTDAEYTALSKWLQDEKMNMMDISINHDLLAKTMYGLAYEENRELKYQANAQLSYILRKKELLEQQGNLVTPIFQKQYFYHHQIRLAEAVKNFKNDLKLRYTPNYMVELRQLRSIGLKREEILQLGMDKNINDYCVNTLKRYATHWGIF